MSRKPTIDKGGRVFLTDGGRVYEGIKKGASCGECHFGERQKKRCSLDRRTACMNPLNGFRGYRILRPVERGVVS